MYHSIRSHFTNSSSQNGRSYSAPGITRMRRQPTLRDQVAPAKSPSPSSETTPPPPPDTIPEDAADPLNLLRLNIAAKPTQTPQISSPKNKLPPGAMPKSSQHSNLLRRLGHGESRGRRDSSPAAVGANYSMDPKKIGTDLSSSNSKPINSTKS